MAEERIYTIEHGEPRLGPFSRSQRSGVRLMGELNDVAATRVTPSDRRIQYWTFGDVRPSHSTGPPTWLQYDLTFLSPNAIGWERSKTYGHVHVGSGGCLYSEVYEVLEGTAGIFVQDLLSGPSASVAVLVQAGPGETVAVPPGLHHATINLGATMLVLGDVVARAAEDDYALIKAAHGMCHYIGSDRTRPNPSYQHVPSLVRVTAVEWSEPIQGPLFSAALQDPAAFGWLWDPRGFAERFPSLAARHGTVNGA